MRNLYDSLVEKENVNIVSYNEDYSSIIYIEDQKKYRVSLNEDGSIEVAVLLDIYDKNYIYIGNVIYANLEEYNKDKNHKTWLLVDDYVYNLRKERIEVMKSEININRSK